MYTPETQAEIESLRQRTARGEMTLPDWRRVAEILRAGRLSARQAPSRTKKTLATPESLMAGLMELKGGAK